MRNGNYIEITDKINQKEYNKILEILKEYAIEPVKIEKIRSVYKITSEGRIFCLKKMKHGGEDKVQKGLLLSKHLISNGFYQIVKYIKTKENKHCVRSGRYIYYVTDWIKGRESDFDNYEELKRCAQLLAEFHVKAKGFSSENLKIANNVKKWPSIFKNDKTELELIRNTIKSKKVKTSFDLHYLKLIDEHTEEINNSIKLLDDSNYIDISNAALHEKTICHDSFYYQNIMVKQNEKMYIIDLDSALYDINIYDLAKFIRRILYKSIYAWNFDIARELIEIYSKINPLKKEEYVILLAFLLYPHKFIKLGKKRYIKRTKWVEDKYLRKLNKIVRYKEKQLDFKQRFIEHYLDTGEKIDFTPVDVID